MKGLPLQIRYKQAVLKKYPGAHCTKVTAQGAGFERGFSVWTLTDAGHLLVIVKGCHNAPSAWIAAARRVC